MKKSDFHYELPEALIAQAPLAERSASRLLLVPPGDAAFADLGVRDLPSLLQPGDLLVFNDTRVIPARLFGTKATGGRVELLIERLLPGNEARAQLGFSKPPKPGSRIALDAGGEAEVLEREDSFWRLRFHVGESLEQWLQHAGRLGAEQSRRDHAGVVEHQQVARLQQRRQVAHPEVRERGIARRHQQQAAGGTLGKRRLRDQRFRQLVVEIRLLHGAAGIKGRAL